MAVKYSIKVSGVKATIEKTALSETVRRAIIRKSLEVTGIYTQGRVQMRTPVGATGQTRGRITYRVTMGKAKSSVVVGGKSITPGGWNVLQLLEEGTGIYGPSAKPIVPKNGKFLRFPANGMTITGKVRPGGYVYAKSVKGIKPVRMFGRTLEEDGDSIKKVFNMSLAQGINVASKVKAG